MKILVTGGAGFIGSHIVDALIEKGYEVVVVDNLSTGKRENVNKKARFYKADIKSRELEKIFQKERPNFVNHQAAQKNVRISIENPRLYLEDNGIGTINVLENCKKYGIKKIVFASTGGAIYDSRVLPAKEDITKINPLSPYGITKLVGELYLKFYSEVFGLKCVSLRYNNVYGPRQDFEGEAGVVAIFTNQMLNGKVPIIFGDGNQSRDFVYVGDVVRANIMAMEDSKADNKTFNVGTCTETSVNKLFNMLKNMTGYKGNTLHTKAKKGEVRRMFLSYEKINKTLGWQPEVTFEEGLEETVEWYRKK